MKILKPLDEDDDLKDNKKPKQKKIRTKLEIEKKEMKVK